LRRICRFYGSSPQFILASATIANPDEVAGRLVEAPVTVIGPERDGAPQGEKHLLFYNPPLVDPSLGIRRSSSTEAGDIAAHFLEHDVQTIVFARARLTTELILTYLRSESEAANGRPGSAIRGYRGGYLPLERREIEKGLREGAVRTVVATNALELGIDIGRLDAAVLAGYPGTIASTRQQMGRAGRRQGLSVGVLVAGPDPLDQYIVTHPEWVLARSPEHARLNPDNEVILAGHLACAAAEIPVRAEEVFGPRDRVKELLADLAAEGQLYTQGGRYFWAGDGTPAAAISLRSAGPEQVVIQATDEAGRPDVIGQIDRLSAPAFVHTGALYMHEGASYQVEALDWENGIAHVRAVSVDYYTRPSIAETIQVVETRESLECGSSASAAPVEPAHSKGYVCAWGDVRVISQATGYRILRRGTNETLGFGVVDLPEQALETQGCWLTLTEELIEQLRSEGAWLSSPNEYGPNWPEQRKAARARDGFRCQGCGSVELPGHEHDVHHKIPFRSFVADPLRREGLPAHEAWQVANRLENLVTLCPGCHRRAEANVRTRSGLGGMAALLSGVIPLFLMCDPSDIGILPEAQNPVTGLPTITIYEKVAGGIGYAEQLYRSLSDVLTAAHDLVRGCPCDTGCPACVGPVPEHDYMLDTKMLTSALLAALRRLQIED
jgi:DEAD/DEAH box helicase domain-containing protein